MHSTTAVLQSQPFSLGYPPSSSASDCIGSQRFYSPSTAFTSDEESGGSRIGSIGHTLLDPGIAASNNGLSYSPRHSSVQDVPYAAGSGGLLMSPADGTPADSIVSNPTSIFPQQLSSWSQRMPGVSSPPRIPAMQPAVTFTGSLQGSGSSLSNNPIMGRDNYLGGYALTRTTFPSPSPSINDFPRYPYSSSVPQGLASHMDPVNPMWYIQPHRADESRPEAPLFHDTENIHQITLNNQKISPIIQAKIHKGFFQSEEKWTCYRRNYFSISCSFILQPWAPNATYCLQTSEGQHLEIISSFAMSISAVVNASENEPRELVQHTPKRDKQSERKPEKVVLRPLQPPPYYLSSNMGGPGGHHHPPVYGMTHTMDYSAYALQQSQPPTQHTFERIQFQKATANNGKRRAQQQYYNLVVELLAQVNPQEGPRWVKVAKRLSDPMVVRGRSPGHYKDGRRDSSASMGDSGGRGNHGDIGGRGILPSSSIDYQSYGHLNSMYNSSQRGGHYDRNLSRSHHHHRRNQQHRSHHYEQYGQINQSAEISPLISTSDASLEFVFPETIGGHQSSDGLLSHSSNRYHNEDDFDDDDDEDNKALRRGSGSTGSSIQSHVPSLDLSSSSGTLDNAPNSHSMGEAYDPMISSYHSEQEDGSSPYSKQPNTERCPLASIVNDDSQCSRGGGTSSFSRFIDPVQESLCA